MEMLRDLSLRVRGKKRESQKSTRPSSSSPLPGFLRKNSPLFPPPITPSQPPQPPQPPTVRQRRRRHRLVLRVGPEHPELQVERRGGRAAPRRDDDGGLCRPLAGLQGEGPAAADGGVRGGAGAGPPGAPAAGLRLKKKAEREREKRGRKEREKEREILCFYSVVIIIYLCPSFFFFSPSNTIAAASPAQPQCSVKPLPPWP